MNYDKGENKKKINSEEKEEVQEEMEERNCGET